ncbi:exosortase E/protease, VPEID-CTERM system [Mangrovimicrobium sediminis]|uniref:Exosortase E/protease, VPEID-CTERM system n=1 Tax=Mangrovimicrobium sediminis TaxID=2562682 RepID=A0A4Z0LZR7_9GAMM|nr:exosortase E/protease, VPEID-CTERM system [Haliea sp. SAOS-164]TGD72545.1 exosortase E/protease, VPEID-CTERM system [Haliea sp. SAOS-164]
MPTVSSPLLTPHRAEAAGYVGLCVALLSLVAEVLYISFTYDAWSAQGQSADGLVPAMFSLMGWAAKYAVVVAFILLFVYRQHLAAAGRAIAGGLQPARFALFFAAHLAAYACLLAMTALVFPPGDARAGVPGLYYAGWLAAALATGGLWCLVVVRWSQLVDFLAGQWRVLLLALLAAAVVVVFSLASQRGWDLLSGATFSLAASLLHLVNPDLLFLYPEKKLIGLGDFIAEVGPPCSGLEGIGLVTVFVGLYLYLERDSLRFPRALALFPLGAAVIWLLNGVRIAALVAIGHYWSPQVAIGGFHSQAGWITFILVSLGVLWLANNLRFFHRAPRAVAAPLNLPVATLLPLIALLAVTLLDSALVAQFNTWYPLRVLVVAGVLAWVWRPLALFPYRPNPLLLPVAVLVAVLWVALLGSDAQADAAFQSSLDALGPWGGWWLALRIVGTVVTVPIAEELAFRAYLLCRLSGEEVSVRGAVRFSWVAVVVSSLAFGFLHSAWLAGTLAGLCYALLRLRTRHVGDAILCHALTNGLLVVFALATGSWSLL